MKPDFIVSLGDFAFERYEVPEEIPFGGDQTTNVHDLPGGGRVVDVMGARERDKAWSGLFQGKDALSRALRLDAMRQAGLPLKLSWHELSYTVVIATCELDFKRKYLIGYRINCIVVSNDGAPKSPNPAADADAMIKGDAASVAAGADRIGNVSLSDAARALSSAVRSVQSFVTATTAQIEAVAAPLMAMRETVQAMIHLGENLADDPIGAILAGDLGTIANTADAFANQLQAMDDLGELYRMEASLARLDTNLMSIGSTGATVIQAGGDLYRLATHAYGDATAWVDIARATGLVDPMLDGIVTLTVPPGVSGADGVLNAAPGL